MTKFSPELQALKAELLELSALASQSGLPLESLIAMKQTEALNRLADSAEIIAGIAPSQSRDFRPVFRRPTQ